MKIKAYYLDALTNSVHPAEISIENSFFTSIMIIDDPDFKPDIEGIVLPGFIDAHIHIESTMLTPAQFAKVAVKYGTTSVVADPHEIANVLGLKGIEFMIKNASQVPFDFYFTAPSCVPATVFEDTGFEINHDDIDYLLKKDDVVALGEMMNFPGVINGDCEVLLKLDVAKKHYKPIDGHAPLVSGQDLENYINKGITTDHECTSFNEAIEKKQNGMKIMVRDASSAKNIEALFNFKDRINFWKSQDNFGYLPNEALEKMLAQPIFDFIVSDDKHVSDLVEGHLNKSVKKAREYELDIFELLKMITVAPAIHYRLGSGLIMEGMKANFIIVDNLEDLNVKQTYVGGKLVFDGENVLFNAPPVEPINNFNVNYKMPEDFDMLYNGDIANVNVIKCFNDELLTEKVTYDLKTKNQIIQCDIDKDILKIANIDRFGGNTQTNGFIQGFNLKKGAIATSISHDSHNILTVGVNSKDCARAVNLIIENKGGIAVVDNEFSKVLPLPIAGLMSNKDAYDVADIMNSLERIVRLWGCELDAPFTTLSFMALLVIPSLKISNKGLFDVDKFTFIDVINE